MENPVESLRSRKSSAMLGGGKDRIQKQHQKGKLTARERLEKLLDAGSFLERNMLVGENEDVNEGIYGDGLVTGFGKINGRRVCVYSQDCTIHGGSVGPIHRGKLCALLDAAIRARLPVIGLHDSAGGRLETPGESREPGFGRHSIFERHTRASGVIPQITAILGPCSGNAVYGPALTDFIFTVEGLSYMFITGPRAVKQMMGVDVTMDELGSARIVNSVSGVADFRTRNEEDCFQKIKDLLSFLPSNNSEKPPVLNTGDSPDRLIDDLDKIIPGDPRKPFDMHQVINRVVDKGQFLEVKGEFARNIIVGFGRLNSRSVGIIANQPLMLAGALTVDSSDKESRFIRFCDAFNIPIVFLVDTPGYMPGTEQEHTGIIRHGAKVLFAMSEATVPKLTVLMRKCYGGANPAMGGDKDQGIDHVFAWPFFEGSTMGADASVDVLFAREIAQAPNPVEYRLGKVKEFRQKYANPWSFAASGRADDIIEPAETRAVLIRTMEMMADKTERPELPKKHGIMPV